MNIRDFDDFMKIHGAELVLVQNKLRQSPKQL